MVGGPTVFVSYKRDHEASLALVAELEAALHREGMQVLRDVGIEPGDRWSDELWRWLLECSGAVAVLSEEAAESDWCRREWSVLAARESHAGLRVVPVRVGPVPDRADILDDLQAVVLAPGEPDELAVAVGAVVERLRGLKAAPPSPDNYLAAHAAWLRWLYRNAPALGREPFTLADVYVDTECGALTWGELKDDRNIDPFSEKHGGRADLLESVLGYFGDPSFREPVVVQGPAGSGKSAFTLRLANRLLDEGVGLIPVLVRFRDLRLSRYSDVDELLGDAVRVAPADEHPPLPADSLFNDSLLAETTRFGDADISRLVVILDGWDEVTLTGSTRFQQQIEEWLPRLRNYFIRNVGPQVRLLLTGRPSAAVETSRFLRKNTPVLTVRPIRPDQLRTYAARISHHLASAGEAASAEVKPTTWQLDVSRCETAFTDYEDWFRSTQQESDASHESSTISVENGRSPNRRDADVLGSPLLALLAFRTVAAWPGDTEELFARPSALYHALIEVTTEHAGKADPSPEGTVHRGGRTLRRLLQQVAAVITTQGGESVSFTELERRLEGDAALEDWAETATGQSTLHELVVNFYFKGHPELGCEFLHKSFREYLHAEAIVAALEQLSEGRSGPRQIPDREDWGTDFTEGSLDHAASRVLARLLAPQWLTPEVRTHVFWLIERAVAAERERWAWINDMLINLWRWWVEGAHLRTHPGGTSWRPESLPPPVVEMIDEGLPRDDRPWMKSTSTFDLDAHFGDALLQLTAFVHNLVRPNHASSSVFQAQDDNTGAYRFRPFAYDPNNLIARIQSARHRPDGPGIVGAYLRGVDLSELDLGGVDLTDVDLTNADLRHANLAGANLTRANLREANLNSAHLIQADLFRANLREADLNEANLNSAHLILADLILADLRGANLLRADLNEANLLRADLREANLNSADLILADLRGADLRGADLNEANLNEANLNSADLSDADLPHANLDGADVSGVRYNERTIWPEGFRPPPQKR